MLSTDRFGASFDLLSDVHRVRKEEADGSDVTLRLVTRSEDGCIERLAVKGLAADVLCKADMREG